MPHFSKRSKDQLATCDQRLQDLFNLVIQKVDCKILEGHRGQEAQDRAFREGRSRVRWPNGRHNFVPSRAVDVVPYPVDWLDLARFRALAKVVKECAEELGTEVQWGGDWKTFVDMPHWELVD